VPARPLTDETLRQVREQLVVLFRAGLARVHGRQCVSTYLQANRPSGPTAVIATGKAACDMLAGVMDIMADELCAGLVISPPGQAMAGGCEDRRITHIRGNHPVPGEDSLAAGRQLLDFINRLPAECHLLFLVSGGTSSLLEVPAEGVGLADLQAVNRWLLASGLDIGQMNRVRFTLSQIKGGQLHRFLGGRACTALLLSDVPGDEAGNIGSGLLHPALSLLPLPDGLPDWVRRLAERHRPGVSGACAADCHIIGNNRAALDAIVEHAQQQGIHATIQDEPLAGDAELMAARIAAQLRVAQPGICLWGGETTVRLPASPGTGGRNQQLALAVATHLAGYRPAVLLAAGTDGRDGCSEAAGAVIDSCTVERGERCGLQAADCLQRADAGSFLAASDDLLITGPTGTNVMDIVIGMKLAESSDDRPV